MPRSRRSFLKGAGLATAVASAAPLALSLSSPPEAGFGTVAGAAPRGFAAGSFALELDGKVAGVVAAFQGGNVVADVVEVSSGGDGSFPGKSLGKLHYEEITVEVPLSMDAALWAWVDDMLKGSASRRAGAILFLDVNQNVTRRLEFNRALLTEVSIPALDAASKDAGQLRITFQPESTQLKPGAGKLSSPAATKQKLWHTANFRLSVGSLPCGRVNKIEALTIKQKVTEFREGTEREPQILPGKLEFPNLVCTFAAIDVSPWQAFFDDFVLKENDRNEDELGGTLELMSPDLKTALATLQFFHLGIFRLAPEELPPSSTNVQRFEASLYSEGNRLFVGNLSLDSGGG
jgi:phage tail-like protein